MSWLGCVCASITCTDPQVGHTGFYSMVKSQTYLQICHLALFHLAWRGHTPPVSLHLAVD